MGVDTDVWLKVVDRAALREALDAYAKKDRQEWIDRGREADYDERIAAGYDPKPLLRPLDDGSVSIFTGMRFQDRDMEYAIRSWLHSYFGDALGRIHDDPRGVFVSPDVCEPRAQTYEGVIAELKEAGRFIDPSPPTKEEEEVRTKAFEAYLASMDACRAAKEAGDDEALQGALATAPEDVRTTWAEQEKMAQRMAAFANGPRTFELNADTLGGMPDALSAMFAGMIEKSTVAMEADPLGFGRVSMLLPAVAAKALSATPPPNLDVQARTELADGSVILVTSSMGESIMEACTVAEALAAVGIDRAALGELPFFRESVGESATSAKTFAEAKQLLGDRVQLLPLRTWPEHMQDEKAATTAWLEKKN